MGIQQALVTRYWRRSLSYRVATRRHCSSPESRLMLRIKQAN